MSSDKTAETVAATLDAIAAVGDVVGKGLDGWGGTITRGVAAAFGLVGALIRAGRDVPVTITRITSAIAGKRAVDDEVDAEVAAMIATPPAKPGSLGALLGERTELAQRFGAVMTLDLAAARRAVIALEQSARVGSLNAKEPT